MLKAIIYLHTRHFNQKSNALFTFHLNIYMVLSNA